MLAILPVHCHISGLFIQMNSLIHSIIKVPWRRPIESLGATVPLIQFVFVITGTSCDPFHCLAQARRYLHEDRPVHTHSNSYFSFQPVAFVLAIQTTRPAIY